MKKNSYRHLRLDDRIRKGDRPKFADDQLGRMDKKMIGLTVSQAGYFAVVRPIKKKSREMAKTKKIKS